RNQGAAHSGWRQDSLRSKLAAIFIMALKRGATQKPEVQAPFDFDSIGRPAFFQASSPPVSAHALVYPRCRSFCAKLALEPSFGQVQYATTDLFLGISARCCSSLSAGTRIASGNFTSDCAQACGLRVSMTTKSSPASILFFNSSVEILRLSGIQDLLS